MSTRSVSYTGDKRRMCSPGERSRATTGWSIRLAVAQVRAQAQVDFFHWGRGLASQAALLRILPKTTPAGRRETAASP